MSFRGSTVFGLLADALRCSHQREITNDELAEARRRLDQILDVLSAIDERRRISNPLDTDAPQSDNDRLAEETYH